MKKCLMNICIIIFFMGCNHGNPPQNSKMISLSSGKSIRLYSIQRIFFADSSHPPSLMLRYETNHPIQDSPELRAEVLEVWEFLRPIVDQNQDTFAYIKASEPIRGIVSITRSFTYEFKKIDGNQWKMQEPKS